MEGDTVSWVCGNSGSVPDGFSYCAPDGQVNVQARFYDSSNRAVTLPYGVYDSLDDTGTLSIIRPSGGTTAGLQELKIELYLISYSSAETRSWTF